MKNEKGKVDCPSCDGTGSDCSKIPISGCERCDGSGKITAEPQPTNVVRLPKNATIIPKDITRKAKKEFRAWKETLIHMINRGCQIEWRRTPDGQFHHKFILAPTLCKIVYEVQIQERIYAQREHAARACKEKGIAMPTDQEIERIAIMSLQQEFMAHTVTTMQQLQKPAADAHTAPTKENKLVTAEEEQAATDKLKQMREQFVTGGKIVDKASDKIKAELEKRKQDGACPKSPGGKHFLGSDDGICEYCGIPLRNESEPDQKDN